MSQIQPVAADERAPGRAVHPARRAACQRAGTDGGRFALPLWLRLLLANPKSRFGLIVIAAMIAGRDLRAADRDARPDRLLAARRQAERRRWHHFFGTTDQGNDIFSQVVWGTRTSLFLGAAAAALATALAATLGMLAAYCGGWVDDSSTSRPTSSS